MRQPLRGRDFGEIDSPGRLLSFAMAPTGSSICSNSLIEFASATMNNIGIRTGGRGDSWLVGGSHGGLLVGGQGVGSACLKWGWRVGERPKRKVWDKEEGVPHDVTDRKQSYEDRGSPGRGGNLQPESQGHVS